MISLVVTFVTMGIEIAGGLLANSVALLSDAAHMFTHAFALGISLGAIYLASSEPCHHRTFGLFRAEVLASLVNSVFLFAVSGLLVYESAERFFNPQPVHSREMLIVAIIGLFVNLLTVWILNPADKRDRNIRSAFMHMIADALSSVAVVAGAVVIAFTGWTFVDPLLAIVISVLIALWAWGLLTDSTRVLLEMVPKGIDTGAVRKLMREADPRITDVPDLHIVEITSGMYDFSAHLVVDCESMVESEEIVEHVNHLLGEKFDIYHTTIQTSSRRQAPVTPKGS